MLPEREEISTTQESMKSLVEALQEVRLANLLQKGVKKTIDPKENQTIWVYKNPDVKRSGILFWTVVSKEGIDYVVKIPNMEEVKLPPTR